MEGVSARETYSMMMEARQGMGETLSKDVASGDSSLRLAWLEALEHELYHRVCLLQQAARAFAHLSQFVPGSEPPGGWGGLLPDTSR